MSRPNGAVCDKGNFSKLNKTKYKFLALPLIRFGGVLGGGGGSVLVAIVEFDFCIVTDQMDLFWFRFNNVSVS